MGIKGVSDIVRLPRLGKIRLGIKNQEGGYPTAVDYFVFDPIESGLTDKIKKVYGDRPKVLDIAFVSEKHEEVFDQWYKKYTYAGLACKGDGENAVEICRNKVNRNGKEYYEKVGEVNKQCPCIEFTGKDENGNDKDPKTGKPYKKNCKMVASLVFMLPKIGLGVWQIDTSSFHSIVAINSSIKMARSLYGRISGMPFLPFKLVLSPMQVTPQATGVTKTVYTMKLMIDDDMDNIAQGKTNAIEGDEEVKQIENKPVALPEANEDIPPDDLFPEEELVEDVSQEKPLSNKDKLLASVKKARVKLGWEVENLVELVKENYKTEDPTSLDEEQLEELVMTLEATVSENELRDSIAKS